MNKKIIFFILGIFLVSSVFAFTGEDVVVNVTVQTENISSSESQWLKKAVAERLEADIAKYTNFTIINSADLEEILKAQAESESDLYDTSLEVGLLRKEDHRFITTVRKNDGYYAITVKYTDLIRGENATTVVSSKTKNVNDLFLNAGNAVDEVMIKLCKELNIELSNTEKNMLLYGEMGLSHEQNIEIYEGDINYYNTVIENLNIEIKNASSRDQRNNLKRKRNDAEEKLRIAEDALANENNLIEKRKQMKIRAIEEKREKDEQEAYKTSIKDFAKSTKPIDMPSSTGGTFGEYCSYVLFGIWPQQKKAQDISIDTSKKHKINGWVCYEGNDGKFYVEENENYYQLMPIKWRVASNNYDGGTLLIAENILDSCSFYEETEKRGKLANTAYPNDYGKSSIRAYLNSINGKEYDVEDYSFNGFLNRAFTKDAIASLKNVKVEFNLHSGVLDSVNKIDKFDILPTSFFRKGNKEEVTDKVFLLSKEELETYQFNQGEKVWKREAVDYAVERGYSSFDKGWWLRSIPLENPKDKSNSNNCKVCYEGSFKDGYNSGNGEASTYEKGLGVVPAIVFGMNLKEFAQRSEPKELPLETKGTMEGDCTYVLFGVWPQDEKSSDVELNTNKQEQINGWVCYEGSDGNYYVKGDKEESSSKFNFLDKKDKYYKLMPIKWRVASDNYKGGKLLIAENILDCVTYYEYKTKRGKHLNTAYPNDYGKSSIRAYLNSLDGSSYNAKNYGYNGFLENAFSPSAIDYIQNVKVEYFKHSGALDTVNKVDFLGLVSTDSMRKKNTDFVTDKVFLLSKEELNFFQYGKKDEIWKREPVDYALSKGYGDDSTKGWWLRSIPLDEENNDDKKNDKDEDETGDNSDKVIYEGSFTFRQASGNAITTSDTKGLGVVPAIIINF